MDAPWYLDHTNLVILLRHLADCGDDAWTLASAAEKPWKYDTEYRIAVDIRDHETAHPGHTCRPDALGDQWYCDPDQGDCGWARTTEAAP